MSQPDMQLWTGYNEGDGFVSPEIYLLALSRLWKVSGGQNLKSGIRNSYSGGFWSWSFKVILRAPWHKPEMSQKLLHLSAKEKISVL